MKAGRLSSIAIVCSAMAASAEECAPLVSVKTTCELVVATYCRGAFGFAIWPDGHWRAGPEPASGRVSEGQITTEELSQLRIGTERVFNDNALRREECVALPRIPGVTETVVLTVPQQRPVTLRGAGGIVDPSCGAANSDNSAVFKMADDLMQRYYPRQF
jgi:hypothetical protein